MKMQDKIAEAEQHVKTLEELRNGSKETLEYLKEDGEGANYDELSKEVLRLVDALDFAIDFIKWGMK